MRSRVSFPVWSITLIPWPEEDRGCFGFATFKNPDAAIAFIQQAPRTFNIIEALASRRYEEEMPNGDPL